MTVRLQSPRTASARQPGALSEDEVAAIVAGPVRDALIDGLATKLNTTVVELSKLDTETLWRVACQIDQADAPAAAAARRPGFNPSYRPPRIHQGPMPLSHDAALNLQAAYRQPREAIRIVGPRPPKLFPAAGA
jgi:hypothetical protein